ncbi:hypothetical protein FB468_0829 [Leucobacter komagatae]|uniref:Uncharacterized protein n=2 Tax=Leucobacter komagatae TaxID=55969 RepID=A0A542Y436_9MICO|nr:hypothetical protein FB468_0829 [Leucobacter komagatae]
MPTDAALIDSAIARLSGVGWCCRGSGKFNHDRGDMGGPLSGFEGSSALLEAWGARFGELSSSDQTVWFLSQEDYNASGEPFAWDEFRRISIEAAVSETEKLKIAAFWREHVPILLGVADNYWYLAVRSDGVVVSGREPEFEATDQIAPDFRALLTAIAAQGNAANTPETVLLPRELTATFQ